MEFNQNLGQYEEEKRWSVSIASILKDFSNLSPEGYTYMNEAEVMEFAEFLATMIVRSNEHFAPARKVQQSASPSVWRKVKAAINAAHVDDDVSPYAVQNG